VPLDLGSDVATARQQPLGSRIVVRGQVTVPPGVVGAGIFYVQAGAVGLRVELAGRDNYPALALGETVEVAGRLSTARGELKLRVSAPGDLRRMGPGPRPAALALRTGAVGEAWEGTLVSLRGVIVRLAGSSLWLDDGSGPARITVPTAAGFKRPRMQRGQFWSATGIVSQYGTRAPFTDGYRLLVRVSSDLNASRAAPAIRAPEDTSRQNALRPAPQKSPTPPRGRSRPWRAPPHWLES
jgi:hypothetical protein